MDNFQKLKQALEDYAGEKIDGDLTDHHRNWIEYIVEYPSRFTGVVGEYWDDDKIRRVLAQNWRLSYEHLKETRDAIGIDMAREILKDLTNLWIKCDVTPEEAHPHLEEYPEINTPEDLKKKMDR